MGASYNQVAESGVIHVEDLEESLATSPQVQNEFREELVNLARSMAKTEIGGDVVTNRPLLSELIHAFRTVDCAALLTHDTIRSLGKHQYKETRVFLLCTSGNPPAYTPTVEKPHKGKLILSRDEDGKLYIPVAASPLSKNVIHIPFPLTAENVETIGGHIGKSLSDAFKLGMKDLTQHKTTKPCIQREKARHSLAQEEIRNEFAGRSRRRTKPRRCAP